MLKIDDLTLKTRHPILTDFSYCFERGKMYGIVAVNGSGKTTFFRAIMGLIPVETGHFKLTEASKGRKELFYFEDSDWFDINLSGLDYLTFIQSEWASSVDITSIIKVLGMSDYIKLPIKKYSLGMKQRLLISLYLVSDASYLLMDEITNGLDEQSRGVIFSELQKLRDKGKMIIISSHYREDIIEYCDVMLNFHREKLVEVSA
ncbi:ATP-binding cassette domain-containing protein [Streptococcus marmotae]|uniref:ATP-binding cassette domain-containing protein n=1 Tax=Streptococcus marmotae TaxID=1825069 RepID=UPI0008349459|nr:ABC transporter ATP-binding protein [Streptococcus marmotae]